MVVRKGGALSFEQVDDPVAGPGEIVVERSAAADERSERLHREALARKRWRRSNPGLYAAQKAARPELHRDRPEPAAEPEPGPEPARSTGRIPKVLTW